MKKRILLIGLVVSIALSSSACSLSKRIVTKDSNSAPITGEIETTAEETTEEPTVAEPQAVKPGNFIEQGNLKISLLKAVQYDKIESDFFDAEPDDGKKYLVLFMEAENISDEDQHINIFYSEAYLDDYEIDQETLLVKPDDYDMFSGDLKPGKKLKGYLCYQVDPDWGKLEMTYTDGMFNNTFTYDFIVTPEDLS